MKAIGEHYYIIEGEDIICKFDCHVLSIDFKGGGGFCTAFPISPKEYREDAKRRGRVMPDKAEISCDDDFTTFIITDDWGQIYEVAIDNCHYSAIKEAKEKAKEYGLLV